MIASVLVASFLDDGRASQLASIGLWVASFVAGQLLLKPALDRGSTRPVPQRVALGAAAIACMTFSFFFEVILLGYMDVSYLFPFQGLSVLCITVGAALLFKERLSAPLLIGSLLVAAGVILVGAS